MYIFLTIIKLINLITSDGVVHISVVVEDSQHVVVAVFQPLPRYEVQASSY